MRAKVKHPFLIVKRDFGFTKTRYRDIAKNLNHLNVLFDSANWVTARRKPARNTSEPHQSIATETKTELPRIVTHARKQAGPRTP